MKKHIKKWCSAALTASMLVSMFGCLTSNAMEVSSNDTSGNQPFEVVEDEKGIHFYGPTGNLVSEDEDDNSSAVINSVNDYYELVGQGGIEHRGNAVQNSSAALPASVDNSLSEFFPEIGNQGTLGACTCWAQTYYQFTYTMNKEMNVVTTPENTFSPKWTYNLCSNGNDGGSGSIEVYTLMKEQGNVPLSMVPYDGDFTSWSPEEEIWKTSIKYRITGYQTFDYIGDGNTQVTSVDDEDLAPIKAALSNGDVLAFSTFINSWITGTIETNADVPENDKYAGEYIVTSQSCSNGSHRMTLVGYNDNIWTDINGNGKVDNGEMGALKIANSWGIDYANDGFIWLAYDALNKESCVSGVEEDSNRKCPVESVDRIDVQPYDTGSSIYLRYTLNTSDRTQIKITIDAEKEGSESTFLACPPKLMFNVNTNPCSFDGTSNANDGTMVVALDNLFSGLTSEDVVNATWNVTFIDKKEDGTPLIVKNAEIVDENTNTVYKPDNVYPITLDGEEQTVEISKSQSKNIVVYYRGYENPNLHYKIGNGEWNSESGVQMNECYEEYGYTHKYIIKTDEVSEAKLYFSDGNGKSDNNGGEYFTASSGLNYFITENAREPMSVKISNDFDSYWDRGKYCTFNVEISGGYPTYQYQYTYINLDTGEETICEYKDNFETPLSFKTVGTYRVTMNVKDCSETVASASMDIEIADIPFVFKEFTVTPSEKILVGQELEFYAVTENEAVISRGPTKSIYTFNIMRNGEDYYTTEVNCKRCNTMTRTSTILLDWTPTETGSYSITISSVDDHSEYAEKTITFDVIDMRIGDADLDGNINSVDVLLIQRYDINLVDSSEISVESADCNKDGTVSLRDATCIQRYMVNYSNSGYVGDLIESDIPDPNPDDSDSDRGNDSDSDTEKTNTVTFANSLNWSGTISCYYWSDSNKSMTSWPGEAMTKAGTNDNNEPLYTFTVPDNATYVIFTNGSSQTVDISYGGGEIRYYPLSSTDSLGHFEVSTW